MLLLLPLIVAPVAAKAASHDCCPEKTAAVAAVMTGTHAQHMQQQVPQSGHCQPDTSSGNAPCSMACCAGLASSYMLPAAPETHLNLPVASQAYDLMAQGAMPAPQAIITPPPRLPTLL